jgi:CBS domain containing-hemolysin-like protein
MEIAFISSNKIYLEIEKQDNFLSKILTKLTEKPSKFIAAMLIGNNIALVVYGFYGVFTDESDRFVRISLF